MLDTQNAKIPATPADAYAYALSWEEELAKIEGIKNPVVVIWQKSLFLSYTNTNVSDTKVKTEVIRRVEQLEPRFDEVFVSSKPEVRRKLLWVQEKMKIGESLGEVVPELENQFNG